MSPIFFSGLFLRAPFIYLLSSFNDAFFAFTLPKKKNEQPEFLGFFQFFSCWPFASRDEARHEEPEQPDDERRYEDPDGHDEFVDIVHLAPPLFLI